jgi:hypothetical protein
MASLGRSERLDEENGRHQGELAAARGIRIGYFDGTGLRIGLSQRLIRCA